MKLIFMLAVMAIIGGISAQYDSMPSNDGASKVLAGAGVIVAAGSGWIVWGAA